jgi:hypothetical protein
VSGDADSDWRGEIGDYLLGRLSKARQSVSLTEAQSQQLLHPPIRRWWTFEGKRYSSIGGVLAANWVEVSRAARQLERAFNPRLRLSERPDGDVDWGRTLSRGVVGPYAEYVLRSSAVGLGEEEHAALRGWIHWIASEWASYAARFEITLPLLAQGSFDALSARGRETGATLEQLRRWVHVARRSRWPLLRDLVAETLRPAVESDALDNIPLPSDRASLFELLCLVRIARRIAPLPDELRWLDRELALNTLVLSGATCSYQQGLDREAVLGTPDFEQGLAEAVPVFGLRIPRQIDISFDLEPERHGISGIIVEAKSGTQRFDAAVSQLRVYRRARPRRPNARYLVWGIVEKGEQGAISEAQLEWVRRAIARGTGDVWVFSSVDSIDAVLGLLGCGRDS